MVASALFFWKGLPFIRDYLSHAETNDAYVTGEPSAVGSRIAEVVKKVFSAWPQSIRYPLRICQYQPASLSGRANSQ
jgi:hypothetical protein